MPYGSPHPLYCFCIILVYFCFLFLLLKTIQTVSRFHDFTGLDFIDFWLQSIYTYTTVLDSNRTSTTKRRSSSDKDTAEETSEQPQKTYRSPPILIVGTHCGNLHNRVTKHCYLSISRNSYESINIIPTLQGLSAIRKIFKSL